MYDWIMRQSPKRANVFSRKRFSHFWDMAAWCLFLSWGKEPMSC